MIIGFSFTGAGSQLIWYYDNQSQDPVARQAKSISPYLVDSQPILLPRRQTPLCNVPEIGIGNKPIDGGFYLFDDAEKEAFIHKEPESEKWFRRWIGSDEFLNGYSRWCLWLGECPPEELRKLPEAMKRVEAVRQVRLNSKSAPTRRLAQTPTRFHVENIPDSSYLVIPEVSSERRLYIPIGFMDASTMSSNLVKIIKDATLYHFGVLSSLMHNAWVGSVAGRLKSDYRYSKDIVYNNFPWPVGVSDSRRSRIEQAAAMVLEVRTSFSTSSLADLYDPLAMPVELLRAHQALDAEVDAAYGKRSFRSEADRVAFLFALYSSLTAPLIPSSSKKRGKVTASESMIS